jgi:hypothetical protein
VADQPTSVRPTLNLIANPDVYDVPAGYFSRSAPATATGPLGSGVTYPAGRIRHDYDATTHEYLGWLITSAALDVWTVPIGIWFNTTSFSWHIKARAAAGTQATTQVLARLDDGTANNRIQLNRSTTGDIITQVTTGGGATTSTIIGNVAAGALMKLVLSCSNGVCSISLNGGVPVAVSGAAVTPATFTWLRIGCNAIGTAQWNGHFMGLAVYPSALDSATMRAKSTADPAHAYPTLSLISAPGAQPAIGTYTRNSPATYTGEDGQIHEAPAGVLRYNYHPTQVDPNRPTERQGLGWLFEPVAATRLNTIAAAPTAPESVTVTAQAYTISWYGAGGIALSGAHAATLSGAGAYPARRSYTFTPSAGTLTMTPSGTVQDLQLEAGPVASSVIRGEGAAQTRAADEWLIPVSLFGFNAAEGALFWWGDTNQPDTVDEFAAGVCLDSGSPSNRIIAGLFGPLDWFGAEAVGGSHSVDLGDSEAVNPGYTPGTRYRSVVAYKSGQWATKRTGDALYTSTDTRLPSGLAYLRIGRGPSPNTWPLSCNITRIDYYAVRPSNDELSAMVP